MHRIKDEHMMGKCGSNFHLTMKKHKSNNRNKRNHGNGIGRREGPSEQVVEGVDGENPSFINI